MIEDDSIPTIPEYFRDRDVFVTGGKIFYLTRVDHETRLLVLEYLSKFCSIIFCLYEYIKSRHRLWTTPFFVILLDNVTFPQVPVLWAKC